MGLPKIFKHWVQNVHLYMEFYLRIEGCLTVHSLTTLCIWAYFILRSIKLCYYLQLSFMSWCCRRRRDAIPWSQSGYDTTENEEPSSYRQHLYLSDFMHVLARLDCTVDKIFVYSILSVQCNPLTKCVIKVQSYFWETFNLHNLVLEEWLKLS